MRQAQDLAFRFPDGFLWGTATAAHQVEGGNANNDWWDWEQVPGRIKDGSRSLLACDHYNRYKEDFRLLAALGQNAHRLSLEWSRIEPSPGYFDPEAIRHYRQVLETLRGLGMEPVVTLHHFTNPRWLARDGGWTRPEVLDAFDRYVRVVVREYGDLVRYWITINEPQVYAYFSYSLGAWPPGRRHPGATLRVLAHLCQAHARAYRTIHEVAAGPEPLVGVAYHWHPFEPYRPHRRADAWVVRARDYLFNRCTLLSMLDGRLRFPLGLGLPPSEEPGGMDFIGLNYYTREMIAFDPLAVGGFFGREVRDGLPRSDFDWAVDPEGLYRSLMDLAAYGKPIIITENGIADARDALRPSYLVQHLRHAALALDQGVPLLGYLHWSSMDNFEWAEGYRMRFGLVHVDFETQARTVRPSGELYAEICRRNGITWAMLDRYGQEAGNGSR